jgi:hypothetical protein
VSLCDLCGKNSCIKKLHWRYHGTILRNNSLEDHTGTCSKIDLSFQ